MLVGRVPGVFVQREIELPAALKDLHGSQWGQPVHGSDRAVEGAAARALQTEAGWVCALISPVPAQRHLPKLSRKSKSLPPPPQDKGSFSKAKTQPEAGACCFYALGDSQGTGSILAACRVANVPSASAMVQGNSAFAPPNQC